MASKKTKMIFAWLGLAALVIVAGVSLAGFFYAKSLENKLHRTSSKNSKLSKVLTQPPSDNAEKPITFLIMGSDSRGDDRGRSDTLMMLRINPTKKTAALLSIPRDFRVPIPGRGLDKINHAFAFGGPVLSIQTVSAYAGVELNHYAEIDFQGFKRVVDALGGVDVDVQPPYSPSGLQHFNGDAALRFVRERHIDSDFARAGRQQQLLKAILDKAIRPASFTTLPELVGLFAENVQTDSNLGIRSMLSYAQLLKSIPQANVTSATLPGTSQMIGGVSYVIPDKAGVDRLLDAFKNDQPLK